MNQHPRFRAALLAAALAGMAIPAAAQQVIHIYTAPAATVTEYSYPAPAATVTEYSYVQPAETYYYTTTDYSAPPIIVTAPRMTEDELINRDVVDVLAHDPYLSGRIGVETVDNDVTLSGSVTTPGQVRRAERNAMQVAGVRDVNNELRARVGGSR